MVDLYAVRGGETFPLPVPAAARDLHDAFDDVPLAIYSALRSYEGRRLLRLDAHIARSVRCVERAGWRSEFDFDGLRVAIDRVVQTRQGADVRVRFDLLPHQVEFANTEVQVLLAVAPHAEVPDEVLREGARLAPAPSGLRRSEPAIKFTDWVIARRICQQQVPGWYEYLLQDEGGRILEGTSSNFYVVRGDAVVTAESGVLDGITRGLVLELAERRGLAIERRRILPSELATCDEAFLTSATREVVPVSWVGETKIGQGLPGPVVTGLAHDYRAYALANAVLATAQ